MENLIKNAINGDKESLMKLILDKKQDYYRLSYVYLGNKEDAMDAMEDMIVILYREIRKLKNEEAFYSWSKTILVNCCKDIIRKSRGIIKVSYEEAEMLCINDGERAELMDLYNSIKTLSDKHQEVIKLKYFLDLDLKTISQICKVPVGTVKSRIFNSINKLKESLGGEYK